MAHERRDIRVAIVAALSGETDAGVRVYASRLAPVRAAELPTILVYTNEEQTDPASAASCPRSLKRTVQVSVEGYLKAVDDIDDAFDALALQIETAMDADLNFGGAAFDSYLAGTELGGKVEGNVPMGVVRLDYVVTYYSDLRVAVQDAALENFDTLNIHHDLGSDQAVLDQAEDNETDIY